MSRKTLATIAVVSMLTIPLAVGVSESFGANAQGKRQMAASEVKQKAAGQKRVDIMEAPAKRKGVQPDSMSAKEERKDVIDEVGSKGDVYPSTGGGSRKDVIENIRD